MAAKGEPLADSMMVAVRIRPRILSAANASHTAELGLPTAVTRVADDTIRLTAMKPLGISAHGCWTETSSEAFTFDAVFDEDATQEEVYNETSLRAVDAAIEGRNATVLAYGHPGSGKTFTTLGSVSQNPLDGDDVVVPDTGHFMRAIRDLLSFRHSLKDRCHVVIAISVVEIYLDMIRDLLGQNPAANLKLIISTDSVDMPDLTAVLIEHQRDALNCYKRAISRRVTRATDVNDQSSRGHVLFCVEVFLQERSDSNPTPLSVPELLVAKQRGKAKVAMGHRFACGREGLPPVRHSRLVLVDLAGTQKKTGNLTYEALEEMKKINSSLTCLGTVVHALSDQTSATHIPFRDSKLTVILRSSFVSPKACVVVIANIAPTTHSFDETLGTLVFANKVKSMKARVGVVGVQDGGLDTESISSSKASDELCAEVRLAREVNNFHLGAPTGVRPQRVLAIPKSARQEALSTAIEQQVASLASAKEFAQLNEDDEALHRRKCEILDERLRCRQEMEKRISSANEQLIKARQRCEDANARRTAALRSKKKKAAVASKTLAQLQTRMAELRQLKQEADLDYESAKADNAHAADFGVFDAEDELHESGEVFHNVRLELYKKGMRNNTLRTEYVALLTSCVTAAVAGLETERALQRAGVFAWLWPVVCNIASNAVAISLRSSHLTPQRAAATQPSAAGGTPSGSASPRPTKPGRSPSSAPMRTLTTPEVASATVFDSHTLVRDLVNYIGATGANLLKHGRSGDPHIRFFYGSGVPSLQELALSKPDNVRIYYCEDSNLRGASGLPFVPINSVRAVTLGQGTPVFQRFKNRDEYHHSFSVHYIQDDQPRTLDLVAFSEKDYEAWVIGICAMAGVNPSYAEPKADVERLPPPHVLTDVEEALCRDWHVRPQLLVTLRMKLEDLRRRRNAPNVHMTPGDMRCLAQLDIFRANVIWRYFVSEDYIAPNPEAIQYLEFDGSAPPDARLSSGGAT